MFSFSLPIYILHFVVVQHDFIDTQLFFVQLSTITWLLRKLQNDHRFLLRFVESSMQDCGTCGSHFERRTQSDCDDTEQRRYTKTRIQTSRFLTYLPNYTHIIPFCDWIFFSQPSFLFGLWWCYSWTLSTRFRPSSTTVSFWARGEWTRLSRTSIQIFFIHYNYNYNIIYSN